MIGRALLIVNCIEGRVVRVVQHDRLDRLGFVLRRGGSEAGSAARAFDPLARSLAGYRETDRVATTTGPYALLIERVARPGPPSAANLDTEPREPTSRSDGHNSSS